MNLARAWLVSVALLTPQFLSAASANAAIEPAKPVAGVDYAVVDQVPAIGSAKQVEVVEVFGYGCIHCAHFAPHVDTWERALPKGVGLIMLPAVFANPSWEAFARAFYAAEVLGVPRHKFHLALFKRNFFEGKPGLRDIDEMGRYFEETYALKNPLFQQAAYSFGVESKVRRSDELARRYRVSSTPTMIVAGKYVVSVRGNGEQALLKVLATTDYLVKRELAKQSAGPKQKSKRSLKKAA